MANAKIHPEKKGYGGRLERKDAAKKRRRAVDKEVIAELTNEQSCVILEIEREVKNGLQSEDIHLHQDGGKGKGR